MYHIPKRGAGAHISWGEIERTVPYFQDLVDLSLCGGEPLLHPEFDRIAREFREMFDPQNLFVTTNGTAVLEHVAALKMLNFVHVTQFPGTEETIEELRRRGVLVAEFPGRHIPMSSVGNGEYCHRKDYALYHDGRLWPCCAGLGLKNAESIALCDDWRTRLRDVPIPCEMCPFSGTDTWRRPE
jgi:hypothetical protein